MKFRTGDMVIVIKIEGVAYPPAAPPGTICSIERACSCPISNFAWILTGNEFYSLILPSGSSNICMSSSVLRKIDEEGRQVVDWDWTELTTKREAVS